VAWLKQIEICSSVVAQCCSFPTSMGSQRLTGLDAQYDTAARPFDWSYNPEDPNQIAV